MSNKLHKLNINLLKLEGSKAFNAKDGTRFIAVPMSHFYESEKGVYLNIDMRANRDGEDQYGNTHFLAVSPTKEQRERKEKTPILGNAKTLTFGNAQPAAQPKPAAKDDSWIDDATDDIPF